MILIGWEELKELQINMDIIKQIAHDYLVLFSMVNAVGNLPVFADLTNKMDANSRKRTFKTAVLTAGSIVLAFALFGDFMLDNIFNVDTNAFKIAGGLLVFVVAANGVISGAKVFNIQIKESNSISVFPLGFPYLAGPGTILTTILLFRNSEILITVSSAVLVYATVLPILYLSPLVTKVVGKLGVSVISRILYIFISAKAIDFTLQGLRGFFSQS